MTAATDRAAETAAGVGGAGKGGVQLSRGSDGREDNLCQSYVEAAAAAAADAVVVTAPGALNAGAAVARHIVTAETAAVA